MKIKSLLFIVTILGLSACTGKLNDINTTLSGTHPIPTQQSSSATSVEEPPLDSKPESGLLGAVNPDGSLRYEDFDNQFFIDLTDDWLRSELEDFEQNAIVDGILFENQTLSDLLDEDFFDNLEESGLIFIAINTSSTRSVSRRPASINIARETLSYEIPAYEFSELTRRDLEQLFDLSSEMENQAVLLGDQSARMLKYSMDVNDHLGEPIALTFVHYIVMDGHTVYIVTLTFSQATSPETISEYQTSAETFRLIETP